MCTVNRFGNSGVKYSMVDVVNKFFFVIKNLGRDYQFVSTLKLIALYLP